MAGVGDVNGDGIADLLLGAYGADPSGRSAAGQAYVIFGRSSFPAAFSLASLNGSTGFTINGSAARGYLGYQVDGAGDVNGDGVADLLIGAISIGGPAGTYTGAAYVVFGKQRPLRACWRSPHSTARTAWPCTGRPRGLRWATVCNGVGDCQRRWLRRHPPRGTVCRSERL